MTACGHPLESCKVHVLHTICLQQLSECVITVEHTFASSMLYCGQLSPACFNPQHQHTYSNSVVGGALLRELTEEDVLPPTTDVVDFRESAILAINSVLYSLYQRPTYRSKLVNLSRQKQCRNVAIEYMQRRCIHDQLRATIHVSIFEG